MKHLSKALLLALMVGVPAMAQQIASFPYEAYDYRVWRNRLLGPDREQLMRICELARRVNLSGMSYYNPEFMRIDRNNAFRPLRLRGIGSEDERERVVTAMLSGQAAAIAIACPYVF